jgi:hypothetical protein
MSLRRAKKFEDWADLKPVTDEEFEELLNDPPRKNAKGGRKKKSKKGRGKREFYDDFF